MIEAVEADSAMTAAAVDACAGCGTEFVVSAKFCYACGVPRPGTPAAQRWTRYLEFHTIKAGALAVRRALGLRTASLVCFSIGVFCVLSAILVGFVAPTDTLAEFQAVQMWRLEWLVGALTIFSAGILLKRPEPPQK
jgi:hypothetical protein